MAAAPVDTLASAPETMVKRGTKTPAERTARAKKNARSKEFKSARRDIRKHMDGIGKNVKKEQSQIHRASANIGIEIADMKKKATEYKTHAKRVMRLCKELSSTVNTLDMDVAVKNAHGESITRVRDVTVRMYQDYLASIDVQERAAESIARHEERLGVFQKQMQETAHAFMTTLDALSRDPAQQLEQAAVNIFRMDGANGRFLRSIMPEMDPTERRGYMVGPGKEPRNVERQKRETPPVGFLVDNHALHFFTLLMNQRKLNAEGEAD